MSKKGVFAIISIIIFIDQFSKIYIKTHYELGEQLIIFDWFRILFVENDGMAWGAKLSDFSPKISDKFAKLFLTIFRILFLTCIGYWIVGLLKKRSSILLILSVSLIFSGALGNIIDSVLYGVIFDSSHGQIATLFPDKGYEDFFYGKVVDMLYFPLFSGYFPEWFPFLGNKYFTFFNPVFNIADMAICTGVGLLLLCNNSKLKK